MKRWTQLVVVALVAAILPLAAVLAVAQMGEDSPGAPAGGWSGAATTVVSTRSATGDAIDGAVSVLVSGMRFQPEVVRLKAGQSVAWTFNDPGLLHSVTAFDGSFDSGVRSGGTFVVRFDRPGTYCYQCQPHPGRNLCEQGSVSTLTPLVLVAQPARAAAVLLDRLGGGGHMQGKVIVEE